MTIQRIYCLTAATLLWLFLTTFSHASPLPADSSEATSPTASTVMPNQREVLLTIQRQPTTSALMVNPFDNLSATARDVAMKGPAIIDMSPVAPAAAVPFPAGNPLPGTASSSSGGKKTHFELQGIAQWKNISSSGSLSTTQEGSFHFSDTLGMGNQQIGPLFRFIWIPEKKILGAENKIWIEYGQINRSRTRTVTASFVFLGNIYIIDSSVTSHMDNKQFKLGYAPRWGNDKFKIGPSFVLERLTLNLGLSDTNAPPTPPAAATLNVPNPAVLIGVDFDYTPNQKIDIYGNAGVVPCCGGGWHIFDSEWGVKYYSAHGFGVMGGVRYSYMRRDFSVPAAVVNGITAGPFSGSLKFPGFGPFVGVSYKF